MTVLFEIGGEIPLSFIKKAAHLNRKHLLDCMTGKAKHFRFSASGENIRTIKDFFKNIPCPFHVYADKEVYAFRPDIRFEDTIDMSRKMSDPSVGPHLIRSARIAENPLPVFQIIKRRKSAWI